MDILLILSCLLLGLVILYLLAIRCRKNHPGLAQLRCWNYAHRGLHGNGVPENSMAAFRAALDQGYGIELDIHLMKDGNLAVIHDTSLARTAGADIKITELTTEQLGNYRLEDTEETIPTFSQVLDLFAEKAPLIIELKADGSNQMALVDAACKAMAGYPGPYCMESFDPRCLYYLRKHHPEVIRGQLTENFFRSTTRMPGILRFLMTHNLLNFLGVPDFIAYNFPHRTHTLSNPICRKLWGAQGVAWTLRSQEEHNLALQEGWIPIFEYYQP